MYAQIFVVVDDRDQTQLNQPLSHLHDQRLQRFQSHTARSRLSSPPSIPVKHRLLQSRSRHLLVGLEEMPVMNTVEAGGSCSEGAQVDACCIRCAQMYKAYPDLQCNPYHREDSADKGLTRREALGCRNCRTRKLKCTPVPEMYQEELAALQDCARTVLSIREQQKIPVAAFYDLRTAQEAFTHACPVRKDRR